MFTWCAKVSFVLAVNTLFFQNYSHCGLLPPLLVNKIKLNVSRAAIHKIDQWITLNILGNTNKLRKLQASNWNLKHTNNMFWVKIIVGRQTKSTIKTSPQQERRPHPCNKTTHNAMVWWTNVIYFCTPTSKWWTTIRGSLNKMLLLFYFSDLLFCPKNNPFKALCIYFILLLIIHSCFSVPTF